MPNLQIKKWFTSFPLTRVTVVGTIALFNGVLISPVVAQHLQSETDDQGCQIIRFRPEISGSDNEWIRIERCESLVRIISTRRAAENRGVLGALNVVSDALGPRAGFTRWYDHPASRIAFKSDRCTEPISLQSGLGCIVTGAESLALSPNIDIYQGVFMIEYTDGDLLRSITFRLPVEEGLQE
jgi:hypothetical protein